MPIVCPVCKAANDRGPSCRRCKADLSLCFSVASQRAHSMAQARRAVADGDARAALAWAEAAHALRADAESRELLAAVAALAQDFTIALQQRLALEGVVS